MAIFTSDESGDFRHGYFYVLHVVREDEHCRGETSDWIRSKLPPRSPYHTWSYCEAVGYKTVTKHECPLDSLHETGIVTTEVEIEIHRGQDTATFLPAFSDLIVTAEFANQLSSSGLSGFKVIPVKISPEQENEAAGLDLRAIDFRGRSLLRRRSFQPPDANRCPFCGNAPLFCPVCGDGSYRCQKCGRDWSRFPHEAPTLNDPRIAVVMEKTGTILEGKNWDGSDFFKGACITKRALDFLLSIHAAPFRAEPARVDVSGCNAAQLKKLEDAKRPLPMKGD